MCLCDVKGMWVKRPWLSAFIRLLWLVFWIFGSYINRMFDLLFFLRAPRWWQTSKLPTYPDANTQRHRRSVNLKHHCGPGSVRPCDMEIAVYVNICLAHSAYSLSYLKKQIISGSAPLPCGTCSSFTEIILSARRGRGFGKIRRNLCIM